MAGLTFCLYDGEKPEEEVWCEAGEDNCLNCAIQNLNRVSNRQKHDAARLQRMFKLVKSRVFWTLMFCVLYFYGLFNLYKDSKMCAEKCSLQESFFTIFMWGGIPSLCMIPLQNCFPMSVFPEESQTGDQVINVLETYQGHPTGVRPPVRPPNLVVRAA
jgi:hypothetical protein